MIENDLQFRVTLVQLGRLLRALESLQEEMLPQNPQLFAAMSEGVLEDIGRLRDELEAYSNQLAAAG
jgi:hypothetical protein